MFLIAFGIIVLVMFILYSLGWVTIALMYWLASKAPGPSAEDMLEVLRSNTEEKK